MSESKCHCGRPVPYAQCCGRYLDDGELPPTAEALMRSRYTAFVLHRWAWLVETHDPRTRGGLDEAQLKASSASTTWQGLNVIDTWQGGEGQKVGKVEFVAFLQERNGHRGKIHERSRFRRFKGQWIYVDGEPQA
ncbi:MAG: YchJ family protein [Bradymonadia bacterium]